MSLRRPRGEPGDRSATWLRSPRWPCGLLAAAAAAVSFQAQFTMVLAAKGVQWVAALEAGIPDAAAVVFACLGIALALHGKRAIRARVLNVGAVATSVAMNAIAAGRAGGAAAIWVMPPVAYALASDTLIGVVRAHAIAQHDGELADNDATPLAVFGRVALYGLRFMLAAPSTATGLRRQVLVMTPLPAAPSRHAEITAPVTYTPCPACGAVLVIDGNCAGCGWPDSTDDSQPANEPARHRGQHRDGSKTGRFLQLVEDRYGDLAAIDPTKVSRISSELAPMVGLHTGSARSVLGKRVRASQNRG